MTQVAQPEVVAHNPAIKAVARMPIRTAAKQKKAAPFDRATNETELDAQGTRQETVKNRCAVRISGLLATAA